MSNPTELLPGTSITATRWDNNGTELRVYTQDIQGNIREARYSEETGWSGGTSKDIIVKAKPNSSMAAISRSLYVLGYYYCDEIRLYYISPDNILREYGIDTYQKTWGAKGLDDLNIEVSPVSRLAAIKSSAWNTGDTSVFYQRPDGYIGNIYYNAQLPVPDPKFPPGWVDKGRVGHKPLFGTGLAAAPFSTGRSETSYNQLFYQLPNGQLEETDIDWVGGCTYVALPETSNAAAATNISAMEIVPSSPPWNTRLHYLDKRNNVVELVCTNYEWSAPRFAGKCLPVPASDISTMGVKDADDLRLYVQDDNNVIQEFVWGKGSEEWQSGPLIPVGNLQ
jgi:hypothetical protein